MVVGRYDLLVESGTIRWQGGVHRRDRCGINFSLLNLRLLIGRGDRVVPLRDRVYRHPFTKGANECAHPVAAPQTLRAIYIQFARLPVRVRPCQLRLRSLRLLLLPQFLGDVRLKIRLLLLRGQPPRYGRLVDLALFNDRLPRFIRVRRPLLRFLVLVYFSLDVY